MFGYPISLDVSGRRAVVIGPQAVEQGKVEPLLAAGAEVTVILGPPAGPPSGRSGPSGQAGSAAGGSPAPAGTAPGRLDRLEADPRVTVRRRPWQPADLDGAIVCITGGGSLQERTAVYRAARSRGVLVNVIDDVPRCDFAAPAVVRRGDLAIAVSTGGRVPALAARLRAELDRRFGPEWTGITELLGEVREWSVEWFPDFADRAGRWRAALDLEELEALVRAGRADEARVRLVDRLTRARS